MRMITPVSSILLRYINNGHKKDNNYDIAKAMLDNFNDIPRMTIHDLADRCYVSPASISRFIRNIGYDSYTSFKKECRESFGIDVDYSKDISNSLPNEIEEVFTKYTESVKENIAYTLEDIDVDQMNRISELIYKSNDIALFGLEFATLLGQHFQIKMASMNKFVKIGITYDEQKEIAESLSDGSLVFIISLEGGYFYRGDEVFNFLKKKNVTIVAITMNNNSKLLRDVDEILVCNKDNSSTQGRITLLYMIELILMNYCINYKNLNK